MNKVITVNLNGNAYQIDEDGYHFLRDYIHRAEAQLHGADKREVIADLEQSIADKCVTFLRPHKNVVTGAEVTQILNEIGPVQTADGQAVEIEPPRTATPTSGTTQASAEERRRPKLYRLTDGAIWGGVCAGLAAYADIHIQNVRGIFIIAACFGGVGFLAYVVMLFIVPVAYSQAEISAAHARPVELRT